MLAVSMNSGKSTRLLPAWVDLEWNMSASGTKEEAPG